MRDGGSFSGIQSQEDYPSMIPFNATIIIDLVLFAQVQMLMTGQNYKRVNLIILTFFVSLSNFCFYVCAQYKLREGK